MSPRPSRRSTDAAPVPDDDPPTVVRRAPYAESPAVGARGQRSQKRILDAALEGFGRWGYHDCGVRQLTELLGCSRAAIYQYFSGKEDIFRHLAGEVARELSASADELEPITGDAAGWLSFYEWLTRWTAIYNAYEPVFVTFQTAVTSDPVVASGSTVVLKHTFSHLRSKVEGSDLPPAQLDAVVQKIGRASCRERV